MLAVWPHLLLVQPLLLIVQSSPVPCPVTCAYYPVYSTLCRGYSACWDDLNFNFFKFLLIKTLDLHADPHWPKLLDLRIETMKPMRIRNTALYGMFRFLSFHILYWFALMRSKAEINHIFPLSSEKYMNPFRFSNRKQTAHHTSGSANVDIFLVSFWLL